MHIPTRNRVLKFIAATITTVVFGLLLVFSVSLSGLAAEIGNWIAIGNYSQTVRWSEAVFHDGVIYVAGGKLTDGHPTDAVNFATVNPDGSLEAWQGTSPLPGKRYLHAVVADDDYLYVLGGWNSDAKPPNQAYQDVWRAPFLENGGVGAWEQLVNLPVSLRIHDAVVANGYIYVIGGRSETTTLRSVYYAKITPGGLSGWMSAADLPHELRGMAVAAFNNRIYVTGGFDTAEASQASVYMAEIQADGSLSPWQNIGALRKPTNYHLALIHEGRLVIIGGTNRDDPAPEFNDVYSAPINATGLLGSWRTEPSLPQGISRLAGVVAQRANNEYIYTIGGQVTGGILSTVYHSGPLGVPTPTPTPTPSPGLNLRMTNDPQGWVPPSGKITYTIQYENPGTESVTEVELKSWIPENTELIPGSINLGTSDEQSSTGFRPGDQITWRFDEIGAGEKDSISYQVLRPLQPTSSGSLVEIAKTGPAEVAPGEPITYTLTLTNNWSQSLNNLIVEDRLPRRAAYVSGGALNEDGYVRWVIPNLPKLDTASVYFVVTANESLINSDYRVRFENFPDVVGRDIVITRVGDTPLPPEGDGTIINSEPAEAAWRFNGEAGSATSNIVSNPSFSIYMPAVSR